MDKLITVLRWISLPVVLSACTSTDRISKADKNQFVTEFYAYVYQVNPVDFASDAGSAAATFGALGALGNAGGNSQDIIGGAFVGALFGGLITAIVEGPSTGYEYQLDAIDGDRVNVIADRQSAIAGECVKVRVSGEVTLVRQPAYRCDLQEEEFD